MQRVARRAGRLLLRAVVVVGALARRRVLPRDRRARDRTQRPPTPTASARRSPSSASSRCRFPPTVRTVSAAASGTGPRRISIRSCRTACRASRNSIPEIRRRGTERLRRDLRIRRLGRAPRRAAGDGRDRYRLPAPGRRPPILIAVLRLVLPKGSLEKATLQLFEDADLALDARLRRRLQGDDRRSPRHRRHDPAPAGDPALRRRRPVRRRRHRPRLDRGDERRGRDAHRAALLEGHGPPDPHGARGRRRLAVAVGHRPAAPTCACTPSTPS